MKVMVKSLLRPLLPFWIIMTLNPLPFETNLEQQGMLFEAFRGYLQFLLAMFTIEMVIVLWSMRKTHGIINRIRQLLSQKLEKLPFSEVVQLTLKKFTMYVCKMIFVSIIYYFVYVVIFIVVSSAYSIYMQQRSEVGPETSLHALENIGLDKSQVLYGLGNARRQLAFESSPLSSTTGRFFSTNTGGTMAMALSSDGNIAFLCTILGNYFSFNIVNISNMESPSLLGSVPLTLAEDNNITNDYSDSSLYQMTMLLSPDEQTVLMSTGLTIEIFNVSNLISPFSVHSYIPVQGDITINSFVFMPDGKSLAITGHYDIWDNANTVYLIIANITNLRDPTVIYSSKEKPSEVSNNEVYFYQGVLWVGSDTYWKIFNISNLTQPQYIATLNASELYGVSVATFSPDYRTIYICYHGDNSDASDFSDLNYCNIFDITNMSNLTQYPTTIPISISVDSGAQTLAITPDNRHLFVTGGDFLQVFDVSNLSSPVQVNNISIPFPNQVVISADGRRALVSTSLQVYSVELYFNVPVSQFYNLQNSLIGILHPPTKSGEVVDSIALSSDGNTLYVAKCLDERFGGPSESNLEIFNVSDPNSISLISDVGFNLSINQIRLSPNGDALVVAFEASDGEASDSSNSDGYSAYSVIEINSTESGESLSSFSFQNSVESFTISPDGKTLFAYYANWTIINITNLTSPSQIGYYYFDPGDTFIGMTISSDGNTAFFTGSFLRIVNISDLYSPTPISNYTLNSANHNIISITISSDNQTAFLTTRMHGGGSYFLEIVNISSLSTPSFISSTSIPDDSDFFQDSDHNAILPNDAQLAKISPDGKTLFVVASGLVILNVSNLTDPSFLGYYSSSVASSIQISPDYSTAFLAHFSKGVIVLNLKSSYIFDMPVTAFPLGKTGSGTLNVLTINSNKTYDAKLMNYKFIGLSLYGLNYEPGYASPVYNYTALPNWMDFDTSTGILSVSPNSDSQVGSYTLYGALSTYIEEDVFLGVANTTTIKEATQLMTTLIGLGYIDNQGFLTSAFDPNTPLKIVSRALPNETEIRNVMSNYYIEAMISISVISSLTLTLGDQSSVDPKISINTLSLTPLSLQITLENTNNIVAKFVDTDYSLIPSFSLDYTTISVVGSLLDINLVLSQFVIFVSSTTPCNGTITVSDGLNSPLTESITNISAYFSKSSQPLYNPSYFQSQIDKVSIVTGDQFIIQFDYDTFRDSDGEDLTYTLAAQDSSMQVPDWMTLRGLDLIGTPPLQLNDRDIPLKIIASNQYQSVEANFTIHVGISWAFALKLVLEYGSGLITVLGLIIYINHIHNIFCKRLYRYPIEFTAKVGEEITSKTIYPIAFIREALLESRFILKKLDKKIAAEIKNSSKSEIANYFRLENNYQIDKANLAQCIEQVVIELLSTKDSDKLRLYVPGINSRKEVIEQLIINKMTMRLIDMKEQSQTKQAFKNIKKNLFKLIELKKHSKDGICEFCVVRSKLYKHLQIKNIEISSSIKNNQSKTEILNESTQETPASMHSPLFTSQPQGVNVDLLVDAIEAYTFKYHNIDADLLDIKIQVKEKAKHVSRPRAIRRFFKMDLIEVNFVSDKRQLGYGLQYETRKGFLRFYGEPDYDIKDRTLAIQITNVKGRILREIWVNGVGNETERESLRESLIL